MPFRPAPAVHVLLEAVEAEEGLEVLPPQPRLRAVHRLRYKGQIISGIEVKSLRCQV